jgi:AraC-like DNA-binding protein
MDFEQMQHAFTSPEVSRSLEHSTRAAAIDQNVALSLDRMALVADEFAHESEWSWLRPLSSLLRDIHHIAARGEPGMTAAAESGPTPASELPEYLYRRLIARYRALVRINTALAKTLSDFRPQLASLGECEVPPDSWGAQGLPRWQVRRAHAFIAANLGRNISTADVAAVCGLSSGYFTAAFRKATGHTPHLYLLKHRIQKAKELLMGTLCIADVALACGFADQAHLTRTFAKYAGVSPGLWRRERRDELRRRE